ADGGTRTAAITGAYVALQLAIKKLLKENKLKENPLPVAVAAASVGIVNEHVLLDLCYVEDVAAKVDMNIVMTSADQFVEVQGSGEESTFSEAQLSAMLAMARGGIEQLFTAQRNAVEAN
ncbi:MAG: ribonuclease PH, partial [Verrucomicrobia bacterium]|nr:ribonuclease PH [Verrucomicrobiota bacterium]